MLETLKRRNKNPSVNPYLRLMDMDNTSPSTFFMMDEIDRTQVLRRYDWSDTLPQYCGTFEVQFKTEKDNRFYIIMRRIANEPHLTTRRTPPAKDELGTSMVMEYYPGTQGRIFTRGLSEEKMQQIVHEYIRYVGRKNRVRRLVSPRKNRKSE
ncbi:MAG: hypothetical protein ACSW8G_02910 [Bacillota bacterium]